MIRPVVKVNCSMIKEKMRTTRVGGRLAFAAFAALLFALLRPFPHVSAADLQWPIDCVPGDSSCFTQIGYPDTDNDGIAHNCSSPGYFGHQGTDISVYQSEVAGGVDVFAADDGEVLFVFDGHDDDCPSSSPDCQAPPVGWAEPGQSNGYRRCTNIGPYCPGGGSGCFWCFDGGNVVVIGHSSNPSVFATRYDHFKKNSITVQSGELVGKGEKIGEVASAGASTGPHLHFEVWGNTFYDLVDPWVGQCGPNFNNSLWALEPPWQSCNGKAVTVDIAAGQSPTSGSDVIMGTMGADLIVALGGNDTICGLEGDDTINAGTGDDWVDAGEGNDQVFGLDGADVMYGGAGADEIISGNGDDVIHGDDGNDTLNGGPGNDLVYGGAGDDDLFGQGGNDLLYGGEGDDFATGVGGVDTLEGGDGNDVLNGGPGNDTINGDAGDDIVFGFTGDDLLDGGSGNDQVFGQAGADTIKGGGGNDALFGNQDDDVITAMSGANTINGGSGNDTITGGSDDDNIFGDGNLLQAGNDVIDGGFGSDLILGFAGTDTIMAIDGVADTVNGGPGVDNCATDAGVDTMFNCP